MMIRFFKLRRQHRSDAVNEEINQLHKLTETLERRIARLEKDSDVFRQRARELSRTS